MQEKIITSGEISLWSYTTWLIVRKSERAGGYTVNIREDAIAKSLETAGWFVLVSNHVEDAQEAFEMPLPHSVG